MTHFLRPLLLLQCKPVFQNGGKLSRGSNSNSFKTVSIGIGVIGVQGKATETGNTKNCNIDQKERKKKKKKLIKSHLKKKSSTLIRLKCI